MKGEIIFKDNFTTLKIIWHVPFKNIDPCLVVY